MAARGVDHVTLRCRLPTVVGVDHPRSLEHHEELVCVVMSVTVVPRPRRQDRPSKEKIIGARLLLVNEELDLHLHPAFFLLQPGDQWHLVQIGAERLGHDMPARRWYTSNTVTKSR